MFPPTTWNVSDNFRNGLPVTTNHVESWHNRLQKIVVIDHPSFYVYLHELRLEFSKNG